MPPQSIIWAVLWISTTTFTCCPQYPGEVRQGLRAHQHKDATSKLANNNTCVRASNSATLVALWVQAGVRCQALHTRSSRRIFPYYMRACIPSTLQSRSCPLGQGALGHRASAIKLTKVIGPPIPTTRCNSIGNNTGTGGADLFPIVGVHKCKGAGCQGKRGNVPRRASRMESLSRAHRRPAQRNKYRNVHMSCLTSTGLEKRH